MGPKSKFRQLAWKLIAILPDIDHDAFEGSDDELVHRRMELHHTCISVIVQGLQELADTNVMISVGEREVPMKILLAAIIGDYKEQEKHAICKGGCLYCKCGKDARDDVDSVFDPITVQEQQQGVSEACAEHFDEDGKPRPRHGEAIRRAEQELGTVLFENAWWKVKEYILLFTNVMMADIFPSFSLRSLTLYLSLASSSRSSTGLLARGSHCMSPLLHA